MRRRILLGNKMTGYIDKAVVYKKIEELEEIAKRRYIDAPWGGLAKTIYQEQFSEIRCLKHLIAEDVYKRQDKIERWCFEPGRGGDKLCRGFTIAAMVYLVLVLVVGR